MKSHLSFLPRPSRTLPTTTTTTTTTTLSSSASDDVPAIYALRENPRKAIKFSDPDCESEAESRDRCGSTFRRKRRSRRIDRDDADSLEGEPVSEDSGISLEEDVARCLMMLCRDDGHRTKKIKENGTDSDVRKKVHQCEICKKCFRSSQALGGHRIIHRKKGVPLQKEKIVSARNKRERLGSNLGLNRGCEDERRRIFECPFCGKVFGSGQALGGHKRSHQMGSPCKSAIDNGQNPTLAENTTTTTNSCIDLNLPAPTEDEDVYSVVSDDDGGCNTN